MAAALSAPNSQAGTSNSQAPPQITTAASTVIAYPIYSTTPPIAASVQDGSASVFSKGWNPATGYGMHSDFFSTPPKMQFKASASQPMTSQPDPSATQPMGTQQDASAMQPNAQGTWSPQMTARANASYRHDPTAASRDHAPTPVSYGNPSVTVPSPERSQLGFP